MAKLRNLFRDKIYTHRVKIFHTSFSEALGNCFCGNNCGNGVSIAHRFAHGHNIWHYIISLKLKGPPVFTNSSESNLDLIGNAHSSSGTNMFKYLAEIVAWGYYLTTAALQALCDVSANAFAAFL